MNFQDPDSPAALRYRDDHLSERNIIAAPELLYYEVANVLTVKAHLPLTSANSALADLIEIQIESYSLGVE